MTVLAYRDAPRVLVLGRSPEVLEAVLRELAEVGTAATGSTRPERAAEEFDAASFDLVAIGRGVEAATRAAIRSAFLRRNPSILLRDTFAPWAVSQITAALEGRDREPRVDLAAYLARIGYRGAAVPTLEVLRALQEHHLAAIVFEGIDVLLGRGIDLSPAAVDAKLIAGRRGGYCYEQNGLFARVLETLGFQVESLVAAVHWLLPPGSPPPARTHRLLRVVLDGVAWLVDVGFGSSVPPAPLRLDTAEPQQTRHDSYRIVAFGASRLLQVRRGSEWLPLYEFSEEPRPEADYQVLNWYTSTNPDSLFRQRLLVARTTPEARYTLLDRRFTIRRPDAGGEQELLDADGLEAVLAETFGLPVEPGWRPLLEQIAAADR